MERRQCVEDLLRRSRRGDRAAMAEIVAMFGERVRAFVRARARVVGSGLEPEDVVQETFLRAMTRLDGFEWKGEGLFFRWLCGIAHNVALSSATRERRRARRTPPLAPPMADSSPSHALRREERMARLEEAFRSLPDEQRRVLRLARIEGLGFPEIATRLRRSPEAVRQIASRGLRRLREILRQTESYSLPHRPLDLQISGAPDPGPSERGSEHRS